MSPTLSNLTKPITKTGLNNRKSNIHKIDMETQIVYQENLSPITARLSEAEFGVLFLEQGVVGRTDLTTDNIVLYTDNIPALITALQTFLPKEK